MKFFLVFFTFVIASVKCEANRDYLISNAADDAIGQTDYLITLYSTQTTKPCLYFCKYFGIFFFVFVIVIFYCLNQLLLGIRSQSLL